MTAPRYLLKLGLFLSPILILTAIYILTDPYKVIYSYDDYNKNSIGILNRDFVSTKVYLANREKHRYNAFIFGNSRTLALHAEEWHSLNKDIRPFHFDASNESLRGIWSKVKFLDEQGDTMKEVIVFLDYLNIRRIDKWTDPAFIHYPEVSKESWLDYHSTFFDAYFRNYIFWKNTYYRMTGDWPFYAEGPARPEGFYFSPVYNDFYIPFYDKAIREDSAAFYKRQMKHFGDKPVPQVKKVLLDSKSTEAKAMLAEMAAIFKKHNTRVHIVIPPLFDQIKLNPADVAYLQNLFGKDAVHDFAGTNEYTTNLSNYYEKSHFRPILGSKILRAVVAGDERGNLAGGK